MGTHPIFESDFDCLTDEMPSSATVASHPHQNGVNHDDFNRIDSIRASQKKRRDDDKRNKELTQNPDLYQLSQKPPVQGLTNDGFDASESWEDILDSLESVPGLVSEIAQLRSFVQSSQVQKAHHLSQVLRDEFPTERSLDDPAKLSDALQMSENPASDELNTFLSDDKLRLHSGIDEAIDDYETNSSINAVEDEALKLAQNFKGPGEKFNIVTIDKNNIFLGATVKNDDAKVIISRIVAGGAVQIDGRLREGDEIVCINTQIVHGKTVDEVCEIMEEITGHVTFITIPTSNHEKSVENESFNVRTMYDYNPDADEYIPCKELGLFFKKGEILKIYRGDDENWWQAYKEGESDLSNLARLVPSTEFEQKRRQINKHLLEEIEKDEEPVLCGKKKKKKKKKKKNKDEEQEDSIMPYEHVKLYQQPPDKKRPIVLVGPRNVGRYELRDKLTSDEPHLFTVPIAHTSRKARDSEMNGQDYYFVEKSVFTDLQENKKFVEYGEYNSNYYGTSIDSVREVVSTGKYAILVLSAPSINVMRKEMLKPFVIFIKPPSKDQIAKNLIREDKQLNESDIENMITSGRIIETDYGHLFDEIIINLSHDQTQRELRRIINKLETMPQWVPVSWIPDGTH